MSDSDLLAHNEGLWIRSTCVIECRGSISFRACSAGLKNIVPADCCERKILFRQDVNGDFVRARTSQPAGLKPAEQALNLLYKVCEGLKIFFFHKKGTTNCFSVVALLRQILADKIVLLRTTITLHRLQLGAS